MDEAVIAATSVAKSQTVYQSNFRKKYI